MNSRRHGIPSQQRVISPAGPASSRLPSRRKLGKHGAGPVYAPSCAGLDRLKFLRLSAENNVRGQSSDTVCYLTSRHTVFFCSGHSRGASRLSPQLLRKRIRPRCLYDDMDALLHLSTQQVQWLYPRSKAFS